MSRSGYVDDCEFVELYRATVARTLRGKRGQAFLRELLDELDAMPDKRLIQNELVTTTGECCTMGVICKSRNLNISRLDIDDPEVIGEALGISRTMAAEIAYMNDEWRYGETPEERWVRMRAWVEENLANEDLSGGLSE